MILVLAVLAAIMTDLLFMMLVVFRTVLLPLGSTLLALFLVDIAAFLTGAGFVAVGLIGTLSGAVLLDGLVVVMDILVIMAGNAVIAVDILIGGLGIGSGSGQAERRDQRESRKFIHKRSFC